MPNQRRVIKSASETLAFGESLAKSLKPGDIVALCGELGAGKTVFAKGIAKGLGITEEVTSPTFTLLRQYQGRLSLCHFDLFRIEDEQELEYIGFYDYAGGDSVCVVEWPENAQNLIPTISVFLSGSGNDERTIEIIEDSNEHTRC